MAQYIYNSVDIDLTGISLFFVNFRYNLTIYQTLLINKTNIKEANLIVNDLKKLYKKLAINIIFLS